MNKRTASNTIRWICFIILTIALACQSSKHKHTDDECKGSFFICIADESYQIICSHQPGEISADKQTFAFQFTEKSIVGNTIISIKIKPIREGYVYLNDKHADVTFDITVKGATDEIYQGNDGWIRIIPESATQLSATFDISLEGYFNKRPIQASGWIKMPGSL
jgi:hypothetical protein